MIAPSPSPGADEASKEAPGAKPEQAEQLKEVEGLIRKILPGQRR